MQILTHMSVLQLLRWLWKIVSCVQITKKALPFYIINLETL